MNVQIQSVKFDASKALIEFIEKKLAKLDRVAAEATGVDVVLKLEKDDQVGNKIAVITLRMPGGDIRVEEQAHTFEEAVDAAKDVLKRQLERRKDK
ncbi:MAG: ribosome-associated translation inhibitor RaiA [Alistipes sp.]|nr:ribosome-associated translation inhibitor RaiA [Alistipes sp.]